MMLETAAIHCPYCGEPVEVVVDCSLGAQAYIEDCPVCCRPMMLSIEVGDEGVAVHARSEDEA